MPVRHHISSLTLLTIAGLAGAVETMPYLIPSAGSPMTTAIIKTVGESGAAGVKMGGIPDGMGAYDNGDGTFTLLMNHELGATVGIVRAHGNKGAWVSRWVINKTTLAVNSITDFNANATSIYLWDRTMGVYLAAGTTAYGRLCSADLPPVSAFYNAATGKGTQNRIFMSGEEIGSEGRAFAHIATGPDAGKSWELPHLGQASWENQLACPHPQDTTIVIGLDDTTPGQLYVYVGTKNSTGVTDVEKAGLVGGTLYGIRANQVLKEDRTLNVAIASKGGSAPFSLVSLGNVSGLLGATVGTTGAKLQTNSVAAGVTEFLRPEDGCWDPQRPSDFYFVTTDRFDNLKNGGSTTGSNVGRSRLWRLRFADITNPTAGGSITMLLDGSENHQMLDNMTMDTQGRILLQEDPGDIEFAAKVWSYHVGTGVLTEVLTHDPALFGHKLSGAAATPPRTGFTKDEESSGVIDVADILGAGKFLAVVQAHSATKYSDGSDIPALPELIEGGQLLVLTYPVPANAAPTAGPVTATTVQATALTIPTTNVLAAVTDAENDAVAVTAATITSGDTTGSVKVVGDKIIYTPSAGFTGSTVITYTVTDGVRLSQPIPRTVMLTHTNGVSVYNSGFGSDLYPVPGTTDQFWLVADRGPNADGSNPVPAASFQKLFATPAYSPKLTKVRWNADNTVTVLDSISLKDDSVTPVGLTGIPNAKDAALQTDGHMEVAGTLFGNAIAADPKGIDSESVAVDSAGNFWVSDEYGPWIVKFDPTGKTLERIGPYTANGLGHKLPAVFAKRTPGRGMESMTITPDGTKLVGIMQSGLMTGSITTESNGKKVAAVRILVYTIATGACDQYVYVLDDESASKRLVACSISTLDGTTFTVLERDGDFGVTAGIKKVYNFTLAGATNINDGADSPDGKLFGGLSVESIAGANPAATATTNLLAVTAPNGGPITPVTKTLVKNLTPLCDAFPHDKWEGVARRANGRLVLVNDDDFGIGGSDTLAAKTFPGTNFVDFTQMMEVDPAKMATATGTITVTVTAAVPPNTAPTITNTLDLTTAEDTATPAIGIVVGDNETAATALNVTATSSNTTLVPNAGLVLGGSGTGRTLVATPAANQNGTTTITVTVSDGTLTASDTFVLTVTPVNDAPVAVDGVATVAAGNSVNGTLTATDPDTGAVLTYSKVANPTKGTVTVNANGTFTYTANSGTSGVDTFTFKANDGTVDSNVATTTVTITVGGSGITPPSNNKDSKNCGLGGGIAALVLSLFVGFKALFTRRRR
jgi:VCBS repeat-containing protein